jgi:hypothetical protein
LAAITAGDKRIDADVEAFGREGPDHSSAKFTDWYGDESITQRLPPDLFIFTTCHQVKGQFIHRRENIPDLPGRFGKLMPIDEYVAQDLLAWYEVTPYKKSSDYLWATDANRAGAKRGKQPVWLGAVMRDYIQPMARNLGIDKKVSWHTFRHTFSSVLRANGEDVKVVQELLRHSTAKMTVDTYTQALSPQKRAAQSKVVGMIRPKPSCAVVVPRVSGEIPVTH